MAQQPQHTNPHVFGLGEETKAPLRKPIQA